MQNRVKHQITQWARFAHLTGAVGLGLLLGGCAAPLPEPVQVADAKRAALPAVKESIPRIKEDIHSAYPFTSTDTWEFNFLAPVNGTHTATRRDALGQMEEKQYAGWFMCDTYKVTTVIGTEGLGQVFMAYFDPTDGKYLYLIREDMDNRMRGCNRLYGRQIITSTVRRR